MSTRSNIAIQRRNKQVEVIYCHCDGYLSHNGKMLLEYYTDLDKINSLIELGNISFLDKYIEPIETDKEHSFYNPQKEVVVAYGRDRNEEEQQKRVYKDIGDYLDNIGWDIEYAYIYKEEENQWYYINFHINDSVRLLTKQVIEDSKY